MYEIKRVYLIGLGAIGASFAYYLLKDQECEFKVIAEGARKKRLEAGGIIINDEHFDLDVIDPAQTGVPADLIIIAVKEYSLDEAIRQIGNFVGPQTQILSVLNGVDSEERVAAVYGWQHVLYSYMRLSGSYKDGVAHFYTSGRMFFGEAVNTPGAYSPRVQAIQALCDRTGILAEVEEDMKRGIWYKFACNIGENLPCAILNVPCVLFVRSQEADDLRIAAMRETFAVANRLGIDLGEKEIEEHNAVVRSFAPESTPSTLQDLRCGRRTEVDMFAGRLVELGRQVGVPTPIAQMFLWCIHILEEKNEGVFEL